MEEFILTETFQDNLQTFGFSLMEEGISYLYLSYLIQYKKTELNPVFISIIQKLAKDMVLEAEQDMFFEHIEGELSLTFGKITKDKILNLSYLAKMKEEGKIIF